MAGGSSFSVLDLFSGAGGFSYGLHAAGLKPIVAIDNNPNAVETYEANFGYLGAKALLRDLATFSPALYLEFARKRGLPESFDVITGGPPCQGWSKVGRGKLKSLTVNTRRSDEDPRNRLYEVFVEYMEALRPRVAVMENVPGMLSFKGGNAAEAIASKLSRPGYRVYFKALNAMDYGVPQSRERLFFVAVRNDVRREFAFPPSQDADGSRLYPLVSVKDAIGDLPIIRNGSREWIRQYDPSSRPSTYAREMRRDADRETVFDHVVRTHNQQDLEAFRFLKQGGKYRDLPKHLKRYRDDIFDDKYRKLIASKPSWCVTAHLSRDCYSHIHPTQTRTISIREAARFQSFPDSFYLAGNMGSKMELIGNAVPPILARVLGDAIRRQLLEERASNSERRSARPARTRAAEGER